MAWWGCLALMAGLAVYQYAWTVANDPASNDELMPYPPGFISIYGPYSGCPIPGARQVVIGIPVRILLTALGVLGGAVVLYTALVLARALVLAGRADRRIRQLTAWGGVSLGALAGGLLLLGPRLPVNDWTQAQLRSLGHVCAFLSVIVAATFFLMRRHGPRAHARHLVLPLLTAGSVAVGVAAFLYYVFSEKFYIRYGLAIVPGALCALLAAFPKVRLNGVLLVVGIVVSTTCGVIITRDQISFNEARWRAGRWLLAQGVRPDQIVGGMEFDYWFNEFRGPQPSPRHVRVGDAWLEPLYLLTLDTFRSTYPPARGRGRGVRYRGHEYRRVAGPDVPEFAYRSILEGRDREVQVWRRVDAPRLGGVD